MHFLIALLVFLLLVAIAVQWSTKFKLREAQRADFIRGYSFPKGLIEKLMKRRPELQAKEGQLVARALRQFFLAYLKSRRQFVAMPSQVADDLWHEFILYTRGYEQFCQHAFGQFLHHTPAVMLTDKDSDNTGLRRCWWQCCKEENINPAQATRLPLLFALDAKLGVADGFHYVPDCKALRASGDGGAVGGSSNVHCGADFSTSDGGGAPGSSCAGGDAGGGDGGGCGGGGGGGD